MDEPTSPASSADNSFVMDRHAVGLILPNYGTPNASEEQRHAYRLARQTDLGNSLRQMMQTMVTVPLGEKSVDEVEQTREGMFRCMGCKHEKPCEESVTIWGNMFVCRACVRDNLLRLSRCAKKTIRIAKAELAALDAGVLTESKLDWDSDDDDYAHDVHDD